MSLLQLGMIGYETRRVKLHVTIGCRNYTYLYLREFDEYQLTDKEKKEAYWL